MKLVLATRNTDKIREIKDILRPLPLKVLSMLDFKSVPAVREDGETFARNAVKKAKVFCKVFSLPALADDSGLEVKALEGAPGVLSARFAGPNSTKEKLCKKVLKLLKGTPPSKRSARFVCDIAIAFPDGDIKVVGGRVEGRISSEMRGQNGFGYDPIFVPRGYKKTFAQMKPAVKNRLSHRARALKKAKNLLKRHLRSI